MDGARQDFLAGAALAADQHAGIGSRDHACFRHQFGHARTAEDHAGQPFFGLSTGGKRLGRILPAARRRELQCLVDFFQQHLAVERLGQVTENAPRSGVDRIRDGPVRGQQDDRQRRPGTADFVEQGQAVTPRQAHVADHRARRVDRDACQRLFGRGGRRHAEAAGPQADGQQAENILVVIDDEDMGTGDDTHLALPPERVARGRCGRVRSISARLSIFSCNSTALRWLSFNCWPCFSSCVSSFWRFRIVVGQQARQRMQAKRGGVGGFEDAFEQGQRLGQILLPARMAEDHGRPHLGIRRQRQRGQHQAFAIDLRRRHALQHLVIRQSRQRTGIVADRRGCGRHYG